jgi:hypothetical protein
VDAFGMPGLISAMAVCHQPCSAPSGQLARPTISANQTASGQFPVVRRMTFNPMLPGSMTEIAIDG